MESKERNKTAGAHADRSDPLEVPSGAERRSCPPAGLAPTHETSACGQLCRRTAEAAPPPRVRRFCAATPSVQGTPTWQPPTRKLVHTDSQVRPEALFPREGGGTRRQGEPWGPQADLGSTPPPRPGPAPATPQPRPHPALRGEAHSPPDRVQPLAPPRPRPSYLGGRSSSDPPTALQVLHPSWPRPRPPASFQLPTLGSPLHLPPPPPRPLLDAPPPELLDTRLLRPLPAGFAHPMESRTGKAIPLAKKREGWEDFVSFTSFQSFPNPFKSRF